MTPTSSIPEWDCIMAALDLCEQSYSTNPPGEVFRYPNREVAGFIAAVGPRKFRVWKGSNTIWDWFQDGKAVPNKYGIHSGFYDCYSAALDTMVGSIGAVWDGELIDTGHSLGGAIADLSYVGNPGAHPPITFCSPRVYTVDCLNAGLPMDGVNVINASDLVPHCPGQPLYRHRCMSYRFNDFSMDIAKNHSIDTIRKGLADKSKVELVRFA